MFRTDNKVTKNESYFKLVIVLIFILCVFNIVYSFRITTEGFQSARKLWNPSWLLFGPFLLLSRQLLNPVFRFRAVHVFHLIPFLFFFFFFIATNYSTDLSNPMVSYIFRFYQNCYLLIPLSLLPYSLITMSHLKSSNDDPYSQKEVLITVMAVCFIIIAIIVSLIYFAWGVVNIDMSFDYRYFSYIFLFFVNISIAWFWIASKRGDQIACQVNENIATYKNSELSKEKGLEYKAKIIAFFDSSDIYLTPNLTLDAVACVVNIPKHHLSQVFNVYFGKNFHSFLADYRIAHALKLLNEQPRKLTIESFSYACGFNSKTSFNRYFKERTGVSPSLFQEQLTDGSNREL